MGFIQFIKNFGKEKAENSAANLVKTLASWDPEGASEAEIRSMNEDLDTIVKQVAEAREVYKREQKEADDLTVLRNTKLQAAEILSQRLEAGEAVGEALGRLLTDLEAMALDIERETSEAVEAKAFLDQLENAAKLAAEKLKGSRKELEQAKREMKKAELDMNQAKERARQAEIVAGITNQKNVMGSALAAMKANAAEARKEADAKLSKAKLLAPVAPDASDAVIAAAMESASGKPKVETTDFSARLASLKKTA